MKIKKIMKESNVNKIIQYHSNAQILELLKQTLTEMDYYRFLKASNDANTNNKSIEEYLENNISKHKLLDLIKSYDVNVYDKIIAEMITNTY